MDIEKDMEDYLREKEKIEQSISEKFMEYVTIMFTDIAGYTSFVETHGDLAAKSLLFCHNKIVFEIIKENNGTVIKTIGDAVMASFKEPLDAVQASVAIQKALKEYNSGVAKQKKINIRIGLNAGNAFKDKGDYFGDAVNVAARIEPAGSAGQIMVSQSVHDAVKSCTDIFIRFHGRKMAKGKSRPLDLYRVFIDKEEFDAEETPPPDRIIEDSGSKIKDIVENKDVGGQKADEELVKTVEEEDRSKQQGSVKNRPDSGSYKNRPDSDSYSDSSKNVQQSSVNNEEPSRSDTPLSGNNRSPFEKNREVTERDADFSSMPVHRFDLIWKLSLPIMVILGIFVYFYPQIMPVGNSGNLLNKYVQAFSLLRSGNIEDAKELFLDFGENDSKCQEGLAAIAYRKNSYDEARKYCDNSIAADSGTFYPRVIKGNIFFDTGKVDQAKKAYNEVLKYPSPLDWQKGELFFRMGRISSLESDPEKALEYYNQAMELDGSNVDIMTARGVILEKMGDLQKALNAYDAALKIAPDNVMAATFYRQIKQNMETAQNKEKQERVNKLIQELLEAMHKKESRSSGAVASGAIASDLSGSEDGTEFGDGVDGGDGTDTADVKDGATKIDTWTSRPVTLFFAGNQRKGSISLREGEDLFFELALMESLGASPNVEIVERALMDKLLEELKLSSTDLANPDTALRLGKILSARLIGNLTFLGYAGETKVYLKLIETETSSVKISLSGNVGNGFTPDSAAQKLAQEISQKVLSSFPVRGKIMQTGDNDVLLNIGAVHGVTEGMIMKVFPGEAASNSLKRKAVGAIKIISVGQDGSTGEIVKGTEVIDSTHIVEAAAS
ncbi:putative Adenylate cyclase [Desulfamplus magnetovallimortis]|uniref:Putative Adenylate cyclase n=1 Tax=Desulfamplus magnetovallimortis TaxID=1246637 RepID=A0A1W1HA91_9BACT|nr:adenylate/guanylate cyclase domain-containing protein [Desulfamplus magnetovallimortis]SLM29349.1 putative Adenylate cyclase [Desulfamplus magnetovallimortis]